MARSLRDGRRQVELTWDQPRCARPRWMCAAHASVLAGFAGSKPISAFASALLIELSFGMVPPEATQSLAVQMAARLFLADAALLWERCSRNGMGGKPQRERGWRNDTSTAP